MRKEKRLEKKRAKQLEKKSFRKALQTELREHKSSFIVFCILRTLVLVVLVRQVMLRSYESVFFCALTLLLLYIPSWVQVKLRIELPPPLEITILKYGTIAAYEKRMGTHLPRINPGMLDIIGLLAQETEGEGGVRMRATFPFSISTWRCSAALH